jgi:hypothetical protein
MCLQSPEKHTIGHIGKHIQSVCPQKYGRHFTAFAAAAVLELAQSWRC